MPRNRDIFPFGNSILAPDDEYEILIGRKPLRLQELDTILHGKFSALPIGECSINYSLMHILYRRTKHFQYALF